MPSSSGLGRCSGPGVFSALAPAEQAAGTRLLIGLAIAAVIAYCNATSSARLAARYPDSGGTYVYGRERLGPFWGYLAGWGFVVGKTASCAAMALTVVAYAVPGADRWVRTVIVIAVVAALTLLNYFVVRQHAVRAAAVRHDVLVGRQFSQPRRQFTQRHRQRPRDMAAAVFDTGPDIDHGDITDLHPA